MDGLRAIMLEKVVDEQLKEREERIEEELFKGCKETDSAEKIYTKMILNGISIATKIAAGLSLDLLIDAGIAKPYDEDTLRRSIFSVVGRQKNQTSKQEEQPDK